LVPPDPTLMSDNRSNRSSANGYAPEWSARTWCCPSLPKSSAAAVFTVRARALLRLVGAQFPNAQGLAIADGSLATADLDSASVAVAACAQVLDRSSSSAPANQRILELAASAKSSMEIAATIVAEQGVPGTSTAGLSGRSPHRSRTRRSAARPPRRAEQAERRLTADPRVGQAVR
jgi:hypothetical protein